MYAARRLMPALMFLMTLVLCSTVWGCGSTSTPIDNGQGPTHPPQIVTSTVELTEFCTLEEAAGGLCFADMDVIVIGPSGQIESALSRIKDIELTPVKSLGLEFVQAKVNSCPALAHLRGADGLVMVLLRMEPGEEVSSGGAPSAAEVAAEINDLRKTGDVPFVFADPVWGTNIGGKPWHGGESPLSDFYIPLRGDPISGQRAFCEQWAFGSDTGIGLGTCEESFPAFLFRYHQQTDYTGEGVRIGVFDSRPVEEPKWMEVKELDPLFSPEVHNSSSINKPPFPTQDHGLFVSSLIKAVAPGSDIHLYRVLNKDGLGDLFTLDYALYSFINDWLKDRKSDPELKGAVINLSLGSPITNFGDPVEQLGISRAQWAELEEVWSLKTLLSAAACHKIVVVAAAGNEGYGRQVPAVFPDVIDVMASTLQGQNACYSNEGEIGGRIAAPGGGPIDDPLAALGGGALDFQGCISGTKMLYDDCDSAASVEQRPPECEPFLIGSVTPSEESPAGYAYGIGTSFAAPLVSGLAALIQEAGWSPEVISDDGKHDAGGWVSPDVIAESVRSTTHHDGVIDVPAAVNEALKRLQTQ